MSEPVKRRGRPRKIAQGDVNVRVPRFSLELKLNKVQSRIIETLSRESGYSTPQVLDDVIKHGVLQTRPMYDDVIQCRQNLNERLRTFERPHKEAIDLSVSRPAGSPVARTGGPGPSDSQSDLERGHEDTRETAIEDFSRDDTVVM